jgi:hypothetical protein
LLLIFSFPLLSLLLASEPRIREVEVDREGVRLECPPWFEELVDVVDYYGIGGIEPTKVFVVWYFSSDWKKTTLEEREWKSSE